MSFETSALLATWLAIALLSFAMAGLLRHVMNLSSGRRALLTRSSDLVGAQAPSLLADHVTDGRSRILLFLTEDCDVCQDRLGEFQQLALENSETTFIALWRGSDGGSRLDTHGPVRTVHDAASLFDAFRVVVTPAAALVHDGRIASAGPVGSSTQLDLLVEKARKK